MAARLRARWAGLPPWARWVLAGYLIGFTDGSLAHWRDVAGGGIHAYASWPPPIQVFLVGLVIVDPLVVVLVACVRREGVWLAAGVMVLDIAANWIGNWPRLHTDPATLLRPSGLLPIAVFGLFVLLTAPALLRVMKN